MLDKPRVLVADDEERILMLLQANLEAFGFEVVTAEDGVRALDLLEAESFDAVITDMNMPGAGGMEIIEYVRRACGPTLPVIVITAYGSVQNAVHAMHVGATDYLEKPFDMADLRSCLTKWMESAAEVSRFSRS